MRGRFYRRGHANKLEIPCRRDRVLKTSSVDGREDGREGGDGSFLRFLRNIGGTKHVDGVFLVSLRNRPSC